MQGWYPVSRDGALRPGWCPASRHVSCIPGWCPASREDVLYPGRMSCIPGCVLCSGMCPVSRDVSCILGCVLCPRMCPVSRDGVRGWSPVSSCGVLSPQLCRAESPSRAQRGLRTPMEGGHTPSPALVTPPGWSPTAGMLLQARDTSLSKDVERGRAVASVRVSAVVHRSGVCSTAFPPLCTPEALPTSLRENMCSKLALAALSESPERPPVCSTSEWFVQ